MGTRSNIIVFCSDGKFKRIYCHWDGYLSGVGATLAMHWNNQNKAEALINLGDLSSLGEEIGVKHDFDYHAILSRKYASYKEMQESEEYKILDRMCLAYGRDRDEKDTECEVFETIEEALPSEDSWAEYVYLWNGKEWLYYCTYNNSKEFKSVAQGLIEELQEESN